MSRYLIECTIEPSKLHVLAAKRAEHYQFLIDHQHLIVFGGPTRNDDTGPPHSMIIVVELDSATDAHAFIANEPYQRSGGFTTITVRRWSQVIPELAPGALQTTLDTERGSGTS